MDWNSSRWVTSYFCSLFFCKERQKERELKKKTLTFQLLLSCGWFVIWMAGVRTFTFIRLPNALSNLGVGGFGPNRVKPFGLSSVVLGAGALALVSFLQGERQTHTHTQRAEWGLSKAVWAFHPLENRFRTHYNQRFGSQLFTVCLSTGYCCCCCCFFVCFFVFITSF